MHSEHTANLSLSVRASAFGDAKRTNALLDRLTLRSHMLETRNGCLHFGGNAAAAARKRGGDAYPDPNMRRAAQCKVVPPRRPPVP
ncbi:hypothetical protein CEW88_19675 (plasmid) [Alloyangia pacifica]|uniref:Uncharacterized protein n=1 Tax=Alloyangia pacifica TaxID=311180 RepID=A0A2U8HJH2_9RHOB|nr:hypothetical protein CEW88_19675 [Alloyangia pacifica]